MIDLSVIIINFNTHSYTINCIKSIIAHTSISINYDVRIVDNNSKKLDVEKLEAYILELNDPRIKLLKNYTNLGFGGGNMVGCQFSDAKYYTFLNNDCLLLNDCFSILINEMENNANYGICGPQSYKENGDVLPTLDHYSSPQKELFGRYFLEKINSKKYPKRKKEYTKPKQGQFVSGSFMMLRAKDFWAIGGFDTNIFLYQEETDMCLRLSKLKKYAFLIPSAKFIHFHGVSTPKTIEIKTELKLSLLYVIRKHYGYVYHKFLLTFLQIKYYIKSKQKPKYKYLSNVLLKGGKMKYSLKYKQKINTV